MSQEEIFRILAPHSTDWMGQWGIAACFLILGVAAVVAAPLFGNAHPKNLGWRLVGLFVCAAAMLPFAVSASAKAKASQLAAIVASPKIAIFSEAGVDHLAGYRPGNRTRHWMDTYIVTGRMRIDGEVRSVLDTLLSRGVRIGDSTSARQGNRQ